MGKVVRRPERTAWVQAYLPELFRGVGIPMWHFARNFFLTRWMLMAVYKPLIWLGIVPASKAPTRMITTIAYPEEKPVYPKRYRGLHRLMKREDGTVRCTACMMCATVCPANCIYIEAGERETSASRNVEKFPVTFAIDELLCVVCGMCVEACPCDAIRMDSQVHMFPVIARSEAMLDKEALMSRGSESIAVDGGAGPNWRTSYSGLGELRQIYQPDKS